MTFNQLFVFNKLKELDGYLGEVKNFFELTDEEILASSGNLHIAERLLQLCVDVMLDI